MAHRRAAVPLCPTDSLAGKRRFIFSEFRDGCALALNIHIFRYKDLTLLLRWWPDGDFWAKWMASASASLETGTTAI